MKIGNVEIKNKVVLAPMAGVSNSAYRRIAKEMDVGLIYAEMVSDKAICYGSKKTTDMLYFKEEERPIAQQIFGSDVESFVKAAKYIEKVMNPDIIDINMGCPVPKVAVKAQAGSALLKDVNKIEKIISAVVKEVNCPVTVKIRSGWDNDSINAVEVAKTIEKAGASAITIHARTRSQGYSGKADWNIIKQVKENVAIPVIGNGDIFSGLDAKRMLDETGCDFVMVGRGCLGNPWLLKECVTYLESGKLISKPNFIEKIDMALKHFSYLLEFMAEKQAVLEFRTHAAWYLKGIPGGKEIKLELFKLDSKEEIINLLVKFKESMIK